MSTIGRPVRIVVADDHAIFRDGLCRILNQEPDFTVVGETGSGRHVRELVTRLSPDVLLLDIGMPDLSGLDVLRELQPLDGRFRTILLTASADKHQVIQALKLGAHGLVLKESATAMLLKCIRAVLQGEYWFGRETVPDLVSALQQLTSPRPPSPVDTLTLRELRVIAAIVSGGTNRDISRELGMSEQTVKNHLSHIFDKLGVSNRLELALYAIEHRLLDRLLH